MSEIVQLDKRVTVIESKQGESFKRLEKAEERINSVEFSLKKDIEDIKMIIASAKGSVTVLIFVAPFIFTGLSIMVQILINKIWG